MNIRRISLPFGFKDHVLALGADLKGSFAAARGRNALLVDGFGDLSKVKNFDQYTRSLSVVLKKYKIRPKKVVCDLHPGYYSSRFTEDNWPSEKVFKVQHHHAHIAGAIAEHNIKERIIGVAFDGTGYGLDGNIWGGEFFVGNIDNFERPAHLEYILMPGADMAIKEPWRMAVSFLYTAFGPSFTGLGIDFFDKLDKKKILTVKNAIDRNINSILTSSSGRLFDAAGSIIIPRHKARFEAELPIELEKMSDESCSSFYKCEIENEVEGRYIIKTTKIIRGLIRDLKARVHTGIVAAKFHNTIAKVISDTCILLRRKYGVNKVLLSGGVFQNRLLTPRVVKALKKNRFDVYENYSIPVNDSGIPIGQLAIYSARSKCA